VARFFGADSAMLIRAGKVPDHTPILARSLGISLVGQDDLTILANIHAPTAGAYSSRAWEAFFSPEVVGGTLEILGKLPDALRAITVYRETQYWMQAPHLRLTRTIAALRPMARDKTHGFIAQAVFADFVWLYVLALWDACERLGINGLSRLEPGLKIYLSGDEIGLQNMQRLSTFVEKITSNLRGENLTLPLFPPYFDELHDIITRCVRRPQALVRMARRAEWVLFGQLAEPIGAPPWQYGEDDVLCDKLLGDVALFVGRNSGVHPSLVEEYLAVLQAPRSHETGLMSEMVKPDLDGGTNVQADELAHGSDAAQNSDADRKIIAALADDPSERKIRD